LLSYVQIVASMGPGTYGTKLILSQPLKTKVITEFCKLKMKLRMIYVGTKT